MDSAVVTQLFESLGSRIRLDVYRMLVRSGREGRVAGEIASALDLPPANLSFHLKAMTQAGLLTVEQQGRFQRYRANLRLMVNLVGYLTAECCAGHPEQCAELGDALHCANGKPRARSTETQSRPVNVLFLCTGNSARSIIAEGVFNHLAPHGWKAMSAGSHPAGRVHPRTLALLARRGIAVEGLHSKSWHDLPVTPDIVVTVCASAAGEICPAYLGPVLRSHWGVDDPAQATGTDAEIEAAFDQAYRTLRERIGAFLALPLADLERDRIRFKAELDRIGALMPRPRLRRLGQGRADMNIVE